MANDPQNKTAQRTSEELWDQVRQGRPGAFLGVSAAELPAGWSPLVVRVRCAAGRAPYAPLVEARRAIERLLGGSTFEAARGRVVELRQRLFGEDPPPGPTLVEATNRLALRSGREAILVLDAIDSADDATLRFVRRMILGEERVALPIVIATRTAEPTGPVAELVKAIAERGVVVARPSEPAPEAPRVAMPEIPPDVVRVLRACAVAREPFNVLRVAAALGMTDLAVLDRLQFAADLGVPLEDYGGLEMRLPPALAAHLRSGLLPSYAATLSQALDEQDTIATEAPLPFREQPSPAATSVPGFGEDLAPPPAAAPPPSPGRVRAVAAPPPPKPAAPAPAPPFDHETTEAGLDELFAGMTHAEQVGQLEDAVRLGRVALARIDEMPANESKRLLRVRALFELGKLQWSGMGVSQDFSLAGALEVLDTARSLLTPEDPLALRTRLAVLIANVCYDRGDAPSLDRSLAELSDASRALLAAGDAYGAARLLNDQAAVYVRMGDPVRATHLLEQSRKVFAERADTDPAALAEVAETDHLLARIPLHVEARPGRGAEAIALALRHARSAEAAFRRLGSLRGAARAKETMGRLELARGNVRPALEQLATAARAQETGGDAMGLARTAAAMSEALGALGRFDDAFDLLGESVELNVLKGSPAGLAFNRRSLDKLIAAAGPVGKAARGAGVARAIGQAESVLGRLRLPGEAD